MTVEANKAANSELAKLRRENARLRQERDFRSIARRRARSVALHVKLDTMPEPEGETFTAEAD